MSGFPDIGVSAPSLSNFQFQFNGLTIGAGTCYGIYNLTGFDLPDIRSADPARPLEHGDIIGIDLMAGRDLAFTVDITTDGTSLQHAVDAFATAFMSGGYSEQPFWFKLPNKVQLVSSVRCRKRSFPIDLPYAAGLATVNVLLHATDPKFYGATQRTTITNGGGSNTGSITNNGNTNCSPRLIFAGPQTAVVEAIASNGGGPNLDIEVDTATHHLINATSSLIIDTDTHATTRYQSSPSLTPLNARGWIVTTSVWPNTQAGTPGLPPGASTISYTNGGGSSGNLVIEWADAYLL